MDRGYLVLNAVSIQQDFRGKKGGDFDNIVVTFISPVVDIDIDVKPGAPQKIIERYTAYFVAQCLWDAEIDVKTYEDGTYMSILRIVFSEVFPEIGAEAHRRHGNWASGPGSSEFWQLRSGPFLDKRPPGPLVGKSFS